jgi:uncharacterized protein YciI
MARWVAIFEDTDGMLAVRQQREPAHLACLEAHAPGRRFVGGLWVVEVSDRAGAVALVENDPCYQPEHRKYCILAWGKALDWAVVL